MTTPGSLSASWRERAGELRRYGAEPQAVVLETCAEELDAALRERAEQELTLADAAAESGYSKRRLRELIAEEKIPNAGRKGAPLIRRVDLPVKPGAKPSSSTNRYDAEQDAAELAAQLS